MKKRETPDSRSPEVGISDTGKGPEQRVQSWLADGLNQRFSFICGAGH